MKSLVVFCGIFAASIAQAGTSVGTVTQVACAGKAVLSSQSPECVSGAYGTVQLVGPEIGKDAAYFEIGQLPEFGVGDYVAIEISNGQKLLNVRFPKVSCE